MGKLLNRIQNDFAAIGLAFRLNELGQSIEVQLHGQWLKMDKFVKAEVRTELRELGYGVRGKKKAPREATEEAWLTLARRNTYNPIKDYFTQLRHQPYQQSQTDDGRYTPWIIIDYAQRYFDNPDGMFPTWLFRWMVGAIAKTFEQERNPILVMGGDEEKGKSTWVRWLCPIPNYHREGPIRPDSKDERLRLADIFIQEIPELGNSTRRADVDAFKDHITKKYIIERPPYGGDPIQMPAVCSFIATVNPDGAGFLVSTTGNTRFIVCEVNGIDFGYERVDKDDLWREALWFYDNTYRAWDLTPAEKQMRRDINAKYQMVSALDEVIDQYIEITNNNDDWMATLEIKKFLAPHYRARSDNGFARELSRSLKMRGLCSGREPYEEGKPHRNGWFGIRFRGKTVNLDE